MGGSQTPQGLRPPELPHSSQGLGSEAGMMGWLSHCHPPARPSSLCRGGDSLAGHHFLDLGRGGGGQILRSRGALAVPPPHLPLRTLLPPEKPSKLSGGPGGAEKESLHSPWLLGESLPRILVGDRGRQKQAGISEGLGPGPERWSKEKPDASSTQSSRVSEGPCIPDRAFWELPRASQLHPL